MYHTQENRGNILTSPIECTRPDAWLGDGFYFWYDEQDAIFWGHESKKRKGSFHVYKANIYLENVLNTVFNEDHYNFWLKQIEKAAKAIIKTTGIKPTLKEINQYFKERSKWEDVTQGILFQDLPKNNGILVLGLYYRKRIQLVVYNMDIVENFQLHEETKCLNNKKL